MYRKRLNKKLRRMLNHKWRPEVFPAALLWHGPPARPVNFVTVNGEWKQPRADYFSDVKSWYIVNYINYAQVTERTRFTVDAFIHEYAKWIAQQEGERHD